MAHLLALLPDEVALSRLQRALELDRACHAEHSVLRAGSWEQMRHLAVYFAPQLVIFDPHASGPFDIEECRPFRAEFPSIPLLPYARRNHMDVRDLLRLGALGVEDVVVRDEDDTPAAFHRRITAAFTSCVPALVLAGMGDLLPPRLTALLRDLVSAASQALRPDDVSRLYHRHPNTLREHLRAAGLPPVNKLIVWARLFHAAHLLESPGRTVENVALMLEYPSVAALRNQMHRYVGLTPHEVQARGGLRALLGHFRERHRAGRWDADCSFAGRAAAKENGAGG